MKELPKELTPELLSLVLDIHNEDILSISDIDTELNYFDINTKNYCIEVNIDTLTRLMKEWCLSKEMYLYAYPFRYSIDNSLGWTAELKDKRRINLAVFPDNNSEFEAVLKATHFIAKEKGLI